MPGRSRSNFSRALANLRRSLSAPITEPRDLSGIIKDFEMTYELSWKVLKKVLLENGHQTQGAKDVFSQAFRLAYLPSEQPWIEMISDRNQAAHVYDENDAKKIVDRIRSVYFSAFEELDRKLP